MDSVGLFQTQSSERSSLQSFSARQFKRESDQKIARSRQMCNQTLSSSLEPLSLPEKSVVINNLFRTYQEHRIIIHICHDKSCIEKIFFVIPLFM